MKKPIGGSIYIFIISTFCFEQTPSDIDLKKKINFQKKIFNS